MQQLGLTPDGMYTDPETGITSIIYNTGHDGTLQLLETQGVWTATDEGGHTIPGLFATAVAALENAEAHTWFQYDD